MRLILQRIQYHLLYFLIPLWRRFLIFFKRDRGLQKITLEYYREWKFNHSYLILFFKYENALFYKINGVVYYSTKLPAVIPINQQKTTIPIEIYGYNEVLRIEFNYEVDWEMNTSSFKTKSQNLSLVDIQHTLKYKPKFFELKRNYYKIKSELQITPQLKMAERAYVMKISEPQIKLKEVNLNDYL